MGVDSGCVAPTLGLVGRVSSTRVSRMASRWSRQSGSQRCGSGLTAHAGTCSTSTGPGRHEIPGMERRGANGSAARCHAIARLPAMRSASAGLGSRGDATQKLDIGELANGRPGDRAPVGRLGGHIAFRLENGHRSALEKILQASGGPDQPRQLRHRWKGRIRPHLVVRHIVDRCTGANVDHHGVACRGGPCRRRPRCPVLSWTVMTTQVVCPVDMAG